MSRARDLADLGNNAGGLETLTVSDITDITATADEINLVDGSVSGPLSHRNMIINGAMQVAQRGTSTSVGNGGFTFSLDRFGARASIGSGHTLSQDTDAPDGFTNSLKFTVGTGATPTGTDYVRLLYKFEGYEAVRLQYGQSTAKTVTLSFWVKSSVAGTFGVGLKHTTARNIVGSYIVSQANTWEYVSVSLVGDTATAITNETNGEALTLGFDLGEGPDRSRSTGSWAGTSNTQWGLSGGTKIISTSSATWQITGVQLELGSVATPFEHRSYGDELARCMRYYEKIEPSGSAYVADNSNASTGGYARINGTYSVPKRATPSSISGTGFTLGGSTTMYAGYSTTVTTVFPTIQVIAEL